MSLHELRAGDADNQIAVRAELNPVRALDAPLNTVWIGPGPKNEVVLELMMIAIIDEVDARIDISVFDSAKQAHPGVPCFRIAADEVIRFSGKLLGASRLVERRGLELHFNGERRALVSSQAESHPAPGEEDVGASRARQKTDLAWRLTAIGLESQRKISPRNGDRKGRGVA